LFLIRLAAGASLILDGMTILHADHSALAVLLGWLALGDGALVLVGLWTPFAGSLLVVLTAWDILFRHYTPYPSVLLGSMGAAIVLIGPGALSIDAWLFGWKKIELEN
jgi:putative oxidoreductase